MFQRNFILKKNYRLGKIFKRLLRQNEEEIVGLSLPKYIFKKINFPQRASSEVKVPRGLELPVRTPLEIYVGDYDLLFKNYKKKLGYDVGDRMPLYKEKFLNRKIKKILKKYNNFKIKNNM